MDESKTYLLMVMKFLFSSINCITIALVKGEGATVMENEASHLATEQT